MTRGKKKEYCMFDGECFPLRTKGKDVPSRREHLFTVHGIVTTKKGVADYFTETPPKRVEKNGNRTGGMEDAQEKNLI